MLFRLLAYLSQLHTSDPVHKLTLASDGGLLLIEAILKANEAMRLPASVYAVYAVYAVSLPQLHRKEGRFKLLFFGLTV